MCMISLSKCLQKHSTIQQFQEIYLKIDFTRLVFFFDFWEVGSKCTQLSDEMNRKLNILKYLKWFQTFKAYYGYEISSFPFFEL